jgi:histidinol-phosphatase
VAFDERRPERARGAEAGAAVFDDDLALAHRLADLAAVVALAHFERGVDTIVKADGTPVSEADLEVDRELVAMLRRERPDDAVLSEESGEAPGASGRRWILDPIDGTFNFVVGDPTWGTHVALEEDGELVLGIVTRPVRDERWWATRGGGAFRGSGRAGEPSPLRVSAGTDLAAARVTIWTNQPDEVIDRLARGTVLVEGSLDSVLQVISGELEAVVGADGAIWDHAPAVVLVAEAGGRYRDREGGRRADRGPSLYTNGVIDAALATLLSG